MNTKTISIVISLLTVLIGCAAPAPQPTAAAATSNVIANSSPAVAAVAPAVQATQAVGLTDLLVRQLGVSSGQAQSGAGILFQLAKSQMQQAAFSQLSQVVPGMGGLLAAAPALGGMGGLSSLGGNAGGALGVASAFQQSGLSPSMIQQFIPIIMQYVTNSGGSGVANSLGSAFLGL